ncbi:ABC transporter ATP-binding protein [Candidatus Methanomassiliicoccus intestinalis]|jgi:ABC transporter related protein|uniref:ABC transporter, ATP-binding protein n=3 Tax=Candidatus Methanomassiliicoccus intestinalis TaxID=1406512 RepID=R9T7U5_METII|nr:ABC transporter ATP-binding protein [Candidatus Methanomassiliicoccus intestinalis]AGN25696.1 ABC transporter, ATP-binding protein [Candidatus Methanomassiliicoccus intestinalis Issoire-Mx1]TQS82794.1 MAG: multidrug ABC transporter ATP-binding protein [Candidatus Methanomassiliicoccus intestinalis]TQS84046.1 MAG: multidrug ABC transporter ATP-binding protein [Candidatus Methanomassiliicoccus intestinalis]
MTSEYPIELINLRKEYGAFVAVDDLSLKIKKNSFTGLLGPNGAGKSTSLKILTNLITPTSGTVELNGINVNKNPWEALLTVGTVVETPEFYLYLTPKETFRYLGQLLGMSSESIKYETDTILEKVKMTQWADKKLGTFSKGMRQRIALGQALLNNPDIIILDEPTSGLDPRGMAEMREILKTLRSGSKELTVLMSSHMLHEVSDLCDHVAMVDHGKLLVHDEIDKILGDSESRTVIVKTVEKADNSIIEKISELSNVVNARLYDNGIEIRFKGGKAEQMDLFNALADLHITVYSMSEDSNALENKYLSLIKDSR